MNELFENSNDIRQINIKTIEKRRKMNEKWNKMQQSQKSNTNWKIEKNSKTKNKSSKSQFNDSKNFQISIQADV